MNALEYLTNIKTILYLDPCINDISILREETQGFSGLYRMKLLLIDGSMLEIFERFIIQDKTIQVTKYSFHWVHIDKNIIKRWDNAPHHKHLSTFPHHKHDGEETNVLSSSHPTLLEILDEVCQR